MPAMMPEAVTYIRLLARQKMYITLKNLQTFYGKAMRSVTEILIKDLSSVINGIKHSGRFPIIAENHGVCY